MPLKQKMDKEYVIHLQNGVLHSGDKNNDILKSAGKWMNRENIILSEVTQKDNMYLLKSGF